MNAPRLALAALLSALTSASSPAQPLIPVPMGPAGAGQCIIGSSACGLARDAVMDPVSEAALVQLGQEAVPSLGTPRYAPPAVAASSESAEEDSGTDLIALGGQIINPAGASAPLRGTGLTAASPARQATFDTRVDGTPIALEPAPKPAGLSYVHSLKVESIIGGKGAAFGNDPKLSAGDANFAPGGFGASPNGSR